MLNYFVFQWKLRRLQRKRQALFRQTRKEQESLVDKLSDIEDIEKWENDQLEAVLKQPIKDMLDNLLLQDRAIGDAIGYLTTEYYTNEAERLMLPLPNHDDKESWQKSQFSRMEHLSVKGLADLRSAIRKEKKEQWETWQMRLTLLVGLAGTLIGVIALLKK